jgi:hypothetical protein
MFVSMAKKEMIAEPRALLSSCLLCYFELELVA